MAGPQDNITVNMKIGTPGLLLPTGAEPNEFVDVTEFVQSIDTNRGRDRETDSYQPGTATITLLDTDRRFDPFHEARRGWINFPGNVNTFDSTPDHADLDITGDLSILLQFHELATSASQRVPVSKWAALDASYALAITTSDELQFLWTEDGSTLKSATSTEPLPLGDEALTVLVVHDVDDGAGGNRVIFVYTDDDGVTTHFLGEVVVDATGTTSHHAGAAALAIGSLGEGISDPMSDGGITVVEVHDGLWPNSTIVAQRSYILEAEQATPFTDSTGKVWTITGTGHTFADNGGTPYATGLRPLQPVHIDYGVAGEMFDGFIADWQLDYEQSDTLGNVTVFCYDSLGVLANMELDAITAAHGGDFSGARIDRVLALAEVDFQHPKSIATGLSTLGATTFGTNVLDYVQRCAKAEAGYLFVSRAGTLTFLDRHQTLFLDANGTFVDAHSGAGIGYTRAAQRSTADLLYNRVTGSSEATGTEQEVNDTDSQEKFMSVRTLPVGELFNSADTEVEDLLTYLLQRFKDPESRFAEIEINTMARSTANAELIALLELVDVVTVKRKALNIGDITTLTSIVDGINHRITAGSWTTTLRLSNADTRPFLVLNDITFGVLGQNRLAF